MPDLRRRDARRSPTRRRRSGSRRTSARRIAAGADDEPDHGRARRRSGASAILAAPPRHGFDLLAWAAAARRARRRRGGHRAAGLALEPVASAAPVPRHWALTGTRSSRRRSAGSTRSSRASMLERTARRVPRRPRLDRLPLRAARSCPGYLSAISAVEVDRLGERGVARRIVVASVPVRRSASRSSSCVLGAGARRSAARSTSETRTKIAGFVLVVLGPGVRGPAAVAGADAWRPALSARARASGSRALLGGAFAVCAAPCIGVVLGVDPRARGRLRHGRARRACCSPPTRSGSRVAFVLDRDRLRARDDAPSAGCATTTTGSASRQRRHARRARPAALLQPRLVAARAPEPRARRDRPRPALDSRRGSSSEPRRDDPRRLVTCAQHGADVHAAVLGRERPSRRGAFSSCRSQPTRLPRPA